MNIGLSRDQATLAVQFRDSALITVDWADVTNPRQGAAHIVTGQLENEPREECGVFGVWAPGEDVAKLTYYGLYALQHRGQEAAGIAVADGSQVLVFKDLGLVSQVFDEQTLAAMPGHVAIGHCRYSTTGSTTWENAQPVFRNTAAGTGVALGHNGNLVNTTELARRARDAGLINPNMPGAATTDSDILGALLAHGAADSSIEQAALELLPTVRGAFCLIFMDENTLYAARDPFGVRPLSLGRLDRGWVVASETAALDIVGASFVRDIEPGELLAIDADGVRSSRFAQPDAEGLRLRVRLPGPPGQHPRPDARCTAPGSTSAAGWPARSRSRPTSSSAFPSPAPPPRSGTPRSPESRSVRA